MENKPLDRREFLKATAGTGLAAAIISGSSLATAIGSDKLVGRKEKSFAFFDVCCIHPDPGNSKFILAKPAEPIWDVLKKIHAKAESIGAPLLSLTCLGIQRSNPGLWTKDTVAKDRLQNPKKSEMAFVSLEASSEDVKKAISSRQIFLERHGCSSPEENVRQHAEDVFLYNPNAAKIVQGLGERHWFVFGRSFQYCGEATAVGLLALRKNVTVLEDAILPAGGEWNTIKRFEKTQEYLKSLGAQFARFDSIFA
ncbi:MAG: twin-arginine translocation signal domain-containing protein [Sedimentisphaerales bacterium]